MAGLGHGSNIANLRWFDPDVAHREVVEVVSQQHGAVGPGGAGNEGVGGVDGPPALGPRNSEVNTPTSLDDLESSRRR